MPTDVEARYECVRESCSFSKEEEEEEKEKVVVVDELDDKGEQLISSHANRC